jgi:hypothetical protein
MNGSWGSRFGFHSPLRAPAAADLLEVSCRIERADARSSACQILVLAWLR